MIESKSLGVPSGTLYLLIDIVVMLVPKSQTFGIFPILIRKKNGNHSYYSSSKINCISLKFQTTHNENETWNFSGGE
jgi:hypothetical protein